MSNVGALSKRTWSEEQAFAIKEGRESASNLIIESVAGSGKTTVILEMCKHAPLGSKYFAFNKDIATEMQEKMNSYGVRSTQASTFHKFCWDFLRDRSPRGTKIDKYKVPNLIDKHTDCPAGAKWDLVRFVSLLKNQGFGVLYPLNSEDMKNVLEENGIVNEDFSAEEFVGAAKVVLKKNGLDIKRIDFDDMLYVTLQNCLKKGWNMDRVPVVFLDEAQDTNEVQLALLELFADRLIAVGDRFQAIYAFRGAGANSMKVIEDKFNCKRLYMSISWRCPEKVAEIARERVEYFKARPGAPEGIVQNLPYSAVWNFTSPQDMILCRMNAPLFKLALRLLSEKKKFQIKGKFPEILIKFVKRFKCTDTNEFRRELQAWFEERKSELIARKKFNILEQETDKFDALMELQRECVGVGEMCTRLDTMMRSKGGVVLSTIHGAKGLENGVVVLLKPELIPSKYAVTDEQLEQEYNLKYVAETRAISHLVYIEGD